MLSNIRCAQTKRKYKYMKEQQFDALVYYSNSLSKDISLLLLLLLKKKKKIEDTET